MMAGLLKEAGFEIVKDLDEAFIIIVNTCTVKGPTENNLFKYLEELKKFKYKKVIITGCVPQTLPKELKDYPMLGPSQAGNIVSLVEEVIHDNPITMLSKEKLPRLNLPKIRKNPVVEIIPICEGCLGDPCSYCLVKKARGSLRSYAKEEIIEQFKKAVKERIPEIWLTAQDTGCYGLDIDSPLPKLLKELIAIPGDHKIRLGMINPNHLITFLPEMIEILKSDKMFKFIHIPVQAGNNEVLKNMKRKYTAEEFKKICFELKQAIPEMTIATDVICGFPGETEEQFQDTLELIKEIKPAVCNRSRFWPRPGTKAAKMEDQIHGQETKRRSQLLTDIFKNISRMQNERWLNWQGEVLIDEKNEDGTFTARNYCYKPIIVIGDYQLGDKIQVKISGVSAFYLKS